MVLLNLNIKKIIFDKDDPLPNEIFNILDELDYFNEIQPLLISKSNVKWSIFVQLQILYFVLGSNHDLQKQIEGSSFV